MKKHLLIVCLIMVCGMGCGGPSEADISARKNYYQEWIDKKVDWINSLPDESILEWKFCIQKSSSGKLLPELNYILKAGSANALFQIKYVLDVDRRGNAKGFKDVNISFYFLGSRQCEQGPNGVIVKYQGINLPPESVDLIAQRVIQSDSFSDFVEKVKHEATETRFFLSDYDAWNEYAVK